MAESDAVEPTQLEDDSQPKLESKVEVKPLLEPIVLEALSKRISYSKDGMDRLFMIFPKKTPEMCVHFKEGTKLYLSSELPFGHSDFVDQLWWWDGSLIRPFKASSKCVRATENRKIIVTEEGDTLSQTWTYDGANIYLLNVEGYKCWYLEKNNILLREAENNEKENTSFDYERSVWRLKKAENPNRLGRMERPSKTTGTAFNDLEDFSSLDRQIPNIAVQQQESGHTQHMNSQPRSSLMPPYGAIVTKHLRELGLRVHPVLEDASSQFRALAYMLGLGEELYWFVRRVLVDYIRAQRSSFEQFLIGGNFESYCDMTQTQVAFGDSLTLQAAADLFGVNILLLRSTIRAQTRTIAPRTVARGTIHLLYNDKAFFHATESIDTESIEKSPLLSPWFDGRMSNEIPQNSAVTGQWLLLVYEEPISDEDEFTRECIRILKKKIPTHLNCQLRRFFAYSQGHHVYIFFVIDFSLDRNNIRKVRQPSRRFTFSQQFDLDISKISQIAQHPRLFEFEGYPHPNSVEWDVVHEVPKPCWDPIDIRSRRPYSPRVAEANSEGQKRPRTAAAILEPRTSFFGDLLDDAPNAEAYAEAYAEASPMVSSTTILSNRNLDDLDDFISP